MSLTSALHRTVQQSPNAPMTTYAGRTRTHAEVLDRVSRLASALRAIGVADGDRVAILALNSDNYSEYILGVAWAGAVVNPQNIRWAPAEIAFALTDSETEVLFVDDLFAPVAEQLLADVGCLHTLIYIGDNETPDGMLAMEELVAGHPPIADRSLPDHELAGLFYTGGTTGQPKGVMLSATNLLTSALGSMSTGSFVRPGSRFLHAAPMFHLADLAAWFSICQFGGEHVIVPMFNVRDVLQAIQDHQVSDVLLVPTMIQLLVDDPVRADYDTSSLGRIIYGASPIDDDLLARAFEAFPGVGFTQAYGMTELAPVATMLSPEDHLDRSGRRRSAGRAAPHAVVRVVNADGGLAATGEVGEIVVAGPHVMLGYWQRPEETAAALQADGMHTGDAGYLDADGYLYVVDRIKDMIISGGENIYSAEVENALCAHPSVAAAAVVGIPDEKWGERVHAVVVLQPGAQADADDLIGFVRESIAGYKVPRAVTFADALPLSGAGKVLKRVLRDELVAVTAAKRLTAAGAAIAIAVLAGCGSTVEPGTSEVNQSLDVPSGSGATTVPGTTGTAGSGGTAAGSSTAPGAGSPSESSGSGSSGSGSSGSTVVETGGSGGGSAPTSAASSASSGSTGGASSTKLASGPVSLGFLTTGTSNAKSYGASLGNTVSEKSVDQALVNALNKQGGISGHKITAVFASTDTGTTNWDTDFQAACATFTQDHHVAAVLGYEFTYEPDFESCLSRDSIPHLNDGFNIPSNAVLAAYPYFWSLAVPTIGQRNLAKFQGAIKSGFLTTKNKLGVVLDSCPGTVAAWNSQVLPYLKSQHIPMAPPSQFGCSTGNNAETVSEVGQAANALLRLRTAGVDRIAFVSVSEAPVLFIAATAAQAQGYDPGWIVSSLGQLAVIAGESPEKEMQNTRGYGWMPSQDVPPSLAPPKNAAQKRCLSLLGSQGVHPSSAADYGYAYNACEAMFLYIDALKADNGNPSGAAISQAIAGIGTHFQSLINLNGASDFSNARRNDAPLDYREETWSGGCHCFRYQGPTYQMP